VLKQTLLRPVARNAPTTYSSTMCRAPLVANSTVVSSVGIEEPVDRGIDHFLEWLSAVADEPDVRLAIEQLHQAREIGLVVEFDEVLRLPSRRNVNVPHQPSDV